MYYNRRDVFERLSRELQCELKVTRPKQQSLSDAQGASLDRYLTLLDHVSDEQIGTLGAMNDEIMQNWYRASISLPENMDELNERWKQLSEEEAAPLRVLLQSDRTMSKHFRVCKFMEQTWNGGSDRKYGDSKRDNDKSDADSTDRLPVL
jgi:hypothetical protein